MYKIFADECIHTDLIEALKINGHLVQTVHDVGLSGATDAEIFNHAVSNSLILLTFDRGFGDIFTYNISKSVGSIFPGVDFGIPKSSNITLKLATSHRRLAMASCVSSLASKRSRR